MKENSSKASLQQRRLFFALCVEGNWSKQAAVSRAKKLYHLATFSDISPAQIGNLIELMEKKIKQKENLKRQEAMANELHVRIFDSTLRKMLYSTLTTVGHNSGVVMYFPLTGEVEQSIDKSNMDFMPAVGRTDRSGKMMYKYDVLIEAGDEAQKFLIEYSTEFLQWMVHSFKTNKEQPLCSLQQPLVVGNIYSEVEQ